MTSNFPTPENNYESPPPMWNNLPSKQRHQVKSRFYYLFWGAATVSVFIGQLYVGSGYRQMSRSFNRIMDSIVVEIDQSKSFYEKFY